jgi:hypothetical protein
MKIYSKNLLAVVILAWSSSHLFAGGSITLKDIQPILDQQPKLWHFFLDHFDISPHGGGVRLGKDWGELQGARVAPYEFEAKMKGDPGPYDLKIKIETDGWYFDAQGKEAPDQRLAVSIKEVLIHIGVGPLNPPQLK